MVIIITVVIIGEVIIITEDGAFMVDVTMGTITEVITDVVAIIIVPTLEAETIEAVTIGVGVGVIVIEDR
jgi:hypothetical protein